MSSPPPSTPSRPASPEEECLDANTALDFIEGLCSPEQKDGIERHVDGCALCRQLLSELAREESPAAPPVPSGEGIGAAPLIVSPEERLLEARVERGRSVGRYMLLDRLGVGGMGVVYSAYDPELHRKVALKLLRVGTARTQEGQTRMLREAQAMARLQHPNVLAVFDAGTFGEEVFIAMELVEGSTLTQWLAAAKRSWHEVLKVFVSAGRGLAAAHTAGLIHRDFKPDNVLMGKDGRVRVTDFGLARDVGATEATVLPAQGLIAIKGEEQLTRTGALLGTPAYMAPEQFLGGAVDARTDQFSFCVSLYEALYGERPFSGDAWRGLREGVLGHKVRAPPKGASVPPWLRRVLLRGLSPEPGSRFASMEALLTELERGPMAVRRRRVVVAALAVLMGVGATGYRDVQQRRERCQGAALRFDGVWDAARKKTLSQAFLATGQSYAPDAWSMVERTLDGYTARWARDWTEACEATWVARQQPEPLMHRRHQCLDRSLGRVKAVTDLLALATSAEVREAAHLMGTLPELATCGAQALQPAEAPATGKPVPAAEKEALQTQLARVEALQAARRHQEGLEQARAVYTRARELGERSLEAEALLWQGILHQGLEENPRAEQLLTEAVLAAETLGLDELKARAQLELVWLYGVNQHQLEQAMAWSRQAQATIDRLGGSPKLQYPLHRNLGGALLDAGKYAEATEHFLKARELAAKVLGEDHPRMVGMWGNAGLGLSMVGRYEEATEAVRHGVSLAVKWLGPRHPSVANTQLNLVLLLLHQKRADEALPYIQEAIATYSAQGLPGRGLANARLFLGHIHLQRKEYAEARRELEHSLALVRKVFGPHAPEQADALTGLGEVLSAQGQHTEALASIQQALELQLEGLGPKHISLGETLMRMGKVQLSLGRGAQATASFERALRLEDIEQNAPLTAELRLALAQVLAPRPEQRERARELAQRALEFYARHSWGVREKAEAESLLTRLRQD